MQSKDWGLRRDCLDAMLNGRKGELGNKQSHFAVCSDALMQKDIGCGGHSWQSITYMDNIYVARNKSKSLQRPVLPSGVFGIVSMYKAEAS